MKWQEMKDLVGSSLRSGEFWEVIIVMGLLAIGGFLMVWR